MSLLRAETILETINTQLQALVPSTVAMCARNYPYTFNDASLPALVILMGNDTPVEGIPDNLTKQDWNLEVYVDVIVKDTADAGTLDTTLNAVRLAVHKNIMANYTLGLSFVLMTYPGAVSEPSQKDTGEEPVGVMRMSFTVRYRTSITDPSA